MDSYKKQQNKTETILKRGHKLTLLQQSHDKLAQDLEQAKKQVQKLIKMNAELQNENRKLKNMISASYALSEISHD